MPEAVALGELLIDFISLDRDVPLHALPRFAGAAGGAPANVAVGLARQGVSAGFIGTVGDDPFGRFLRETLQAAGVDISLLRATGEARTTLAFVATRADGRKDIIFYRNPGADTMLREADVERSYLGAAQLFHFGSVSLSQSPAREATLAAARQARELGLLVSYDPNWRPTLWDRHDEAARWIREALPLADVVHCAEEEWEFVTGSADLETGARRLLEAGPVLVVVTRGESGCFYRSAIGGGYVAGFAVEVVDPLGAGDAFVAAMLARLPRTRAALAALSAGALQGTMTYANAAGALTCTKRGVIPSLPTAAEAEAFLASRLPSS
jgi:fructokinase